jgi:hypothetical protein
MYKNYIKLKICHSEKMEQSILSGISYRRKRIITGYISVIKSPRKCYQSCMNKAQRFQVFYEEIVKYYEKSLSKMFRELNDMITDQLVIGRRKKAIKNGTVK